MALCEWCKCQFGIPLSVGIARDETHSFRFLIHDVDSNNRRTIEEKKHRFQFKHYSAVSLLSSGKKCTIMILVEKYVLVEICIPKSC